MGAGGSVYPHRDALDLVVQGGREAQGDGGAGGIGRLEVLLAEPLVDRAIRGIAEVIAGLHHVGEVAAGIMENMNEIFPSSGGISPRRSSRDDFPVLSTEAWPETKIRSPTTTAGLKGRWGDRRVGAKRGYSMVGMSVKGGRLETGRSGFCGIFLDFNR